MSVLGLRVGPFEIVETARIPETGNWYYARRTGHTRRNPREVLVRLLDPDASPSDRAALQRHFDTLRSIEDARIPTAVALYEGMGALAIHAVRGVPLDVVMQGRAQDQIEMTPATLLDIGLEIAETLQHMHHTGTVHGHLSVENVLIGSDGKVWIFGVGPGPETLPPTRWQAPERARGKPASQATDQWSLAAICGAMIVGNPPWTDNDQSQAARGSPNGMIDPIMSQWPALGRLLQRLLDSEPENRHASMHPVRQELLALSRKAGGTSDRRELGAILARQRIDDESEAAATLEDTYLVVPEDDPEEAVFQTHDPDNEAAAESTLEEDPASYIDLPEAAIAAPNPTPSSERSPKGNLPTEQIPVVRPQVRGDVPTAQLGDDEPSPSRSDRIRRDSGIENAMNGPPGPNAQEPDSTSSEGAPQSLSMQPKFPPPPASKSTHSDADEDEEAATVLYGRDAIDKLLNTTPSAAARAAAAAAAEADESAAQSGDRVVATEDPVSRPTAIPSTDSRDPSEEVFQATERMKNAVPLPIETNEPGLGSGNIPIVDMDMPSGPSLGNPAAIVPPTELPERNLTAQRVATTFVVVMGLAMAIYSLWQFL